MEYADENHFLKAVEAVPFQVKNIFFSPIKVHLYKNIPMKQQTLVIGASTNPERYSNKAIKLLRQKDFTVIAFGPKSGMVDDVEIHTRWDDRWEIDTVTLYINPEKQLEYYDLILALAPRRVLFNPGTENALFQHKLQLAGIETENVCTLILLSIGQYA